MTGNRFLLDTNILSAWLQGDKTIANSIDKATPVYIPIIVIGELYYGASFSTQVQKNTENVKKLTLPGIHLSKQMNAFSVCNRI